MKNIVRKIIILFIILIFLYLSISYLIVYYNFNKNGSLLFSNLYVTPSDYQKKTFEEFNYQKKYDLLFIGSSHCYRSFDPRIFAEHGIDSYNLGSSSQTPLNSYSILTKVINNTKSILLEVYPVTLDISGIESFTNLLVDLDDYPMLLRMAWFLKDLRCFQLITFKPFMNYKTKLDYYNYSLGYVETDKIPDRTMQYQVYSLDPKIVDSQLSYVEKIVTLCKKNNVKIGLVYVPVPKELVIKNESYAVAKMNKLCRQYGLHFYNFGRNHSLNSKIYFFDDDHLNKAGVDIFDRKLILEMKKQ